MLLTIAPAVLVINYDDLQADFTVPFIEPGVDGYPIDVPAPIQGDAHVYGNTYQTSVTALKTLTDDVGLYSLLFNDEDGLSKPTNLKTAVRVFPWMKARVDEALARETFADQPNDERLDFLNWMSYWMGYALTNATSESPASIRTS